MKPWNEYQPDVSLYPNKAKEKARRTKEINDARMTAAERREALDYLNAELNSWFDREVQDYRKDATMKERQFWQDCRAEIGYADFLSTAGCRSLESRAWTEAHSGGFEEVYICLKDNAEFVKSLIKELKESK